MNSNENTPNIETTEVTEATETTKATKKPKKVVIIAIAAVLAVALIVGGVFIALYFINNNNAPAEIIKDGEAQYTIVLPDNYSDELVSALGDLITSVYTTTGVRLEYITASRATDADANYILIGATGFKESSDTIESLQKNTEAYVIRKVGKHVVFTGHFDSATATAVKYFSNNVVATNYDAESGTLTVQNLVYDGTTALPTEFDPTSLSRYTIVYAGNDANGKSVATKIQQFIKDSTGKKLTVATDTGTPETPYEILIGETNRYLSQKCYKDGTRLMEYEFVVAKGQLQIISGGLHSATLAGEALADMLWDKDFYYSEGHHDFTDLATERVHHSIGTDVRIMTANILTYKSADKTKFSISAERAEIFAKILVDYTPDFIGLQEVDAEFATAMNSFFEIIRETYGIEYSFVHEKHNGKANGNPIIYRSDKYTMDYEAFTTMSYAPYASSGVYTSGITAAKFTKINDPDVEIAILSSHWHWEKEDEVSGAPKQSTDSTKMAEIVKYLEETYPNARIFSTGDFNSHRFNGKWLNNFLQKINGAIASDIAEENDVLEKSFQHQGQYIDHIIGTKGTFDVLRHAGTNNHSDKLTDHQPVFADIKFTN